MVLTASASAGMGHNYLDRVVKLDGLSFLVFLNAMFACREAFIMVHLWSFRSDQLFNL